MENPPLHPTGTSDGSDICKGFSSFTMGIYEKCIWKQTQTTNIFHAKIILHNPLVNV